MTDINYNPLFWEEIYSIESAFYKKNLARKCRALIKWDNEVNSLMHDPLGNEQMIKSLLAKINYIHTDITLSQNLLNAIENLQTSYLDTTVRLHEASQKRELKYYNQSLELAIKYINATKVNIEAERRSHGS